VAPSQSDYDLLVTAMTQSLFDQRSLEAALLLLRHFELSPVHFRFLLRAIRVYPNSVTVVSVSARCIARFEAP